MYGSCVAAIAAREGAFPPAGDVSDAARWPRPTDAATAAAAAASWSARSWRCLDRMGGSNSVRLGSARGGVRSVRARATTPAAHAAKVKVGGTLLFGAEQEPPCLNNNLNDCNNTWGAYVSEMVMPGIYTILPNFSYQLKLASKVDLQLNPMRVTYHINPKAKWSDGKPVSSADLVFTLKTTLDTSIDKAPSGGGWVSRTGYDLINKTKVIDPKTVQFTFKQ